MLGRDLPTTVPRPSASMHPPSDSYLLFLSLNFASSLLYILQMRVPFVNAFLTANFCFQTVFFAVSNRTLSSVSVPVPVAAVPVIVHVPIPVPDPVLVPITVPVFVRVSFSVPDPIPVLFLLLISVPLSVLPPFPVPVPVPVSVPDMN